MDENTKTVDESATVDDNAQMPPQEAATGDFMKDPEVLAFISLQVQEGIQKALQGKPPRVNTTDPTEQEYKSFAKMTYRERLNLFNTNPQTYNKLAKGAF